MKQHRKAPLNTKDNKIQLWALYLLSVLCGGAMMSLEIVGGRLLSPFFGSSVYVWGSIISIFLVALSSGYYLGGLLVDRKPSLSLLAGVIAASGLLVVLIPYITSPLVTFSFSTGMGNFAPLVVSFALFFLPSLGLGIVSPFVVKLGAFETERLGNAVGKFSAISTVGSIIGTLSTTFILIPSFGVREVLIALGILLLILSSALLLYRRKFIPSCIVAALLAISVLAGNFWLPSLEAKESNRGNLKIVYKTESLYNNISVEDQQGVRYMGFDGIDQSAMALSEPTVHVWPYTRIMESAAYHYNPEFGKALLIGLGGGTIPKAMLDKDKSLSIDAVDIDPEVVKVCYDYFALPRNKQLKVEAVDGRIFLQESKKEYDVIMVDAYNRSSIPFHLTTKEFFEELSKSLRPDGVVIFNVISSIEGRNSEFFKSLLRTAEEIFPHRKIFQSESTSPFEMDNLILVISKKNLDSPVPLPEAHEYQHKIDLSDAIILTDNYAPVETLLELF